MQAYFHSIDRNWRLGLCVLKNISFCIVELNIIVQKLGHYNELARLFIRAWKFERVYTLYLKDTLDFTLALL
jgi:hypothetical protein